MYIFQDKFIRNVKKQKIWFTYGSIQTSEQHSEPICSAIIRIITEGKFLIMKSNPVVRFFYT